MNPHVRQAKAADVDGVVAVGHTTWPPTYLELAGAEYVKAGLARWWGSEGIAEAIAAGQILVAEVDDRVVGVAMFSADGSVVDLWKLYVMPEFQGSGVGAQMLQAVIDGPGSRATSIRLAHKEGNTRARSFYERWGFAETHRTPDDLGGPDNVWMALSLRHGPERD
ncbi:GNAT family N-acetyltransferase [Arthrobacter sp. RAF14]|uniref:GNAT family N-acetyltransferase n=1 Tax=Arthrobacter sp. RAF14 TaxID=3233051 RepID=UPI003F8D9C38